VTDSDLNRIWVPAAPERTRIQYLVPTRRASRRLRAYGSPRPASPSPGSPFRTSCWAGRRCRRCGGTWRRGWSGSTPPASSGARCRRSWPPSSGCRCRPRSRGGRRCSPSRWAGGAQVELAREFLPGFRPLLDAGRIRLALVAGVRPEVEARFREAVHGAGLEGHLGGALEILRAPDFAAYYSQFNALLAAPTRSGPSRPS